MYIFTVITIGSILVSFAVGWGVFKTKIGSLEKEVNELKEFDKEFEAQGVTKADLGAAENRILENLKKDIRIALLEFEQNLTKKR